MINLINFSARNLFRNKRRSVLTLLVIVFSFVVLNIYQGYITRTKEVFGEILIHNEYGHLQIFHKDYFKDDETSYDYMISEDTYKAVENLLVKIPEVKFFSPRINISGLIGNDKCSKIYIGSVRDPKELDNMYYTTPIYRNYGEFISNDTPNGIVIGNKLAEKLNAKVGENVLLLGYSFMNSMEAMNAKIVGLSRTGNDQLDSMFVYLNIRDAKEFLLGTSFHEIVILLDSTENMLKIQDLISDKIKKAGLNLQVRNFYENCKFFTQIIKMYTNQFNVSLFVLSLLIIFSMSNTIYMSITDRIREFSTMKTIGIARRTIFMSIILEGIILVLIGIAIGTILSYFGHDIINKMGITLDPPPGSEERIPFSVSFAINDILKISGIYILVAALASIFPALSVIRMKILKGLSNF